MTSPVTTPAREQEADKAQLAFQAALLYVGAETIEDALALWQDVPVTAAPDVATAWLNRAVAMVLTRRSMSRELAVAYYRLARALRTGRTIPDPRDPIPKSVSLQKLRFEFKQLVDGVTGDPVPAPQRPADAPVAPAPTEDTSEPLAGDEADPESQGQADVGDGDEIEIEDIEIDLELLEDDLAEQAEEEAREVLATLGPIHQERLAAKIDARQPATTVDQARNEAHDRAGVRQASAAERVALNGARGTLYAVQERDRRVIGWVRVSRTGTPCGFCAMLISRGLALKGVDRMQQLYSSKNRAERTEEGDLYHDNCKCYAEPIYSESQWLSNPLYDLNREYARLWPEVTEGLSGDDALLAWRRFIDAQKRDDKTTFPPASAQAA